MSEFALTAGPHTLRWRDGNLSGSPLVHAIVQGLVSGGAPADVAGMFSATAGLDEHRQAYGTMLHAFHQLGFDTPDVTYEGDPVPIVQPPEDALP